MIYWELFVSFFQIGLFGFGGGLAILSLIHHQVLSHGWMTEGQFMDIVAISQVTPGPIGINCATYVGYTATGSVWGSLITTLAIVLPSVVVMGGVCAVYWRLNQRLEHNPYFQTCLRALRWTVLGLVAAAALSMMNPTSFIDPYSGLIFAVVALLTILPTWMPQGRFHRAADIVSHPILLIVLAGGAGWLLYGR